MEAQGFTSTVLQTEPRHGALTRRADFRAAAAPRWSTAVTVYYRDFKVLACVAVDALFQLGAVARALPSASLPWTYRAGCRPSGPCAVV